MELWRDARLREGTGRLLAHPLRLARMGGQTKRVPAVHDHDRWAEHPLLAHPSPEPDATPLILIHGWPGSIMEYLDADSKSGGPPAPAQRLPLLWRNEACPPRG